MIQAPFGSAAPAWTGVPMPAFTWPQLSQPYGNPLQTPQPLQQLPTPPTPSPVTGWFGSGGGPALAFTPLITSLSVPDGMTAQALMVMVAVRRGLAQGPTTDHDVEELIYDALELFPGAAEVDVRCEGGRVTLSGNVPHKRLKHDVGELAWAIPGLNDVTNSLSITGRRRQRAFGGREAESPPSGQSRKQS